jgi:hypothetical protein
MGLRLEVCIFTGAESASNEIKFTTPTQINILFYILCEDWDFRGDVYKFIIIWNEAPYNLTFLLNTEDKGSFSL